MINSLSRTDKEIADIYSRHVKTIYRICFTYMKNVADTEDIVQETFIKLMKSFKAFENEEHEKAWLIRTATNLCKDNLRNWWRKRENLEDYGNIQGIDHFQSDTILEAVMSLPDKYKTVVYLYYYDGYTSVEIARILTKPQSTIRNYLHEARNVLRTKLGSDLNEE
ncbi:MAG: polymerase sigma factor [Herbinix sp.]|jgi:RNA polymerase sigma-70 factor (ECF subfamily)|nr:polymerase sigma factor [Herbinix sp.]